MYTPDAYDTATLSRNLCRYRSSDGARRIGRVVPLVALVAALFCLPDPTVASPRANLLCVGAGHDCYRTLQAALDASRDGDTIRLGRGSFTGGVTITTSVTLQGSGAKATTISGGGPVLTIGTFQAVTQPTVKIKDVTISDGVTTSGLDPNFPTVFARGGGVEIPPSQNFAVGATVTISDTVISHNQVKPSSFLPLDPPINVALAQGGGIDNWGTLTLNNTRVSNNQVNGANTSDADGAGITSIIGSLVLNNSVVSGNAGSATTPNGRFADTGGILLESSSLMMNGGAITANSTALTSTYNPTVDTVASSGAVHIDNNSSATIRHARITGNTVTSTTGDGSNVTYAGGISFDGGAGELVVSDSVVSDNHVFATANSPSTRLGDFLAASGAFDLTGKTTINHTIITNNTVVASTSTSTAFAVSGAMSALTPPDQPVTITDSIITGNQVTASSTGGSAIAFGGAIENSGTLTMRRTIVTGNTASAFGPNAVARGGGIYNSTVPDFDLPVNLTLIDTLIAGNQLTATPGATVEGGGLYTTFPVTMTRTRIAGNSPDQCFGCS